MVEEIVDSRSTKLEKEDIQEIIEELVPQIDKMISRQIRNHFLALATYIVTTFKEGD